jgi:phosphoribosyl-ATP pyrophosphohydrolase
MSVLNDLYSIALDRKQNYDEKSYTCYLFKQGLDKILKKVGEEASEVIITAKNSDNEALTGEICDLAYHLIVLLAETGTDIKDVEAELCKRREKLGNLKELKQVNKDT